MKIISEAKAHGGRQGVYTTQSEACGCDMTFAVFTPPQAKDHLCPVIWYLSGLTCTHANVMDKGEYRRLAAELGLIVVCPDVSPRGDHVPDEPDNWQFGKGAGFYLDATEAPFAAHYKHGNPYPRGTPCPHRQPLRGRHGSPGRHGPFDGRPRRADIRTQTSRPVQKLLGICPDRAALDGGLVPAGT
jgi:hypothetical protein